jgi:hypothetical protein
MVRRWLLIGFFPILYCPQVEELQLAAGVFSGLLEEVVQDMAAEAARDVLEPLLEEFADELAQAKHRTTKLTPEGLEATRLKKVCCFQQLMLLK